MAVVLTLVQTKQIRINIHKRNNIKNTVQRIQNSKYKYTYYQNTHTYTHPYSTQQVETSIVHDTFIHSVFCLTTGPKPSPKRFLHIVRFRASSFKWEYPILSLRSSSSFLRLLLRLLATSISPFIFPSITSFRRQFLRKKWRDIPLLIVSK